jgi:hypothetical protein
VREGEKDRDRDKHREKKGLVEGTNAQLLREYLFKCRTKRRFSEETKPSNGRIEYTNLKKKKKYKTKDTRA